MFSGEQVERVQNIPRLCYLRFMLDVLVTGLVQGLFACLRPMSQRARVSICTVIVRTLLACLPRFRKVARRNIELAFPDLSEPERMQILQDHIRSLGRLLADVVRAPQLSRDWVAKHVHFPNIEALREMCRDQPDRGVLIATGHLGSFELLARSVALWGLPLAFVVRPLKFPRLNRFIEQRRELDGNRVIHRRGALQEAMKRLRRGEVVAMLIDQNVTGNLAVFVPCFGILAATTRAFGLAALRTRAKVLVAGMTYAGDDTYVVHSVPCSFDALYEDTNWTVDEKVKRITAEVSQRYEEMIRLSPAEWFWLHRRWKTRPEGEPQEIYGER